MALIRPTAESAAALAAQQEAAAEQAARESLIADAHVAVEALPAPDGKFPLAGKTKELSVPLVDVANGMVVISDGDVGLAVRRTGDVHEIRLVQLVDGAWTRRSEPVTTLAELGEALEG